MNNKSNKIEDEIDVVLIFRKLWNKKVFILCTAFIFMFLGFMYEYYDRDNYKQLYKIKITTKSPPLEKFLPYEKYYSFLVKRYEISFHNNLSSRDNIQEFVDQNNKIDNFKLYLKKEKLEVREYFQKQFEEIKNLKNNQAYQMQEFHLVLPFKKESNTFLNEYVEYTKEKILARFIEDIKAQIETEMYIYKENLEIAENIGLERPLILVQMSNSKGNRVVNEPESLYYKGAQVLSLQLSNIQNLYQELNFDNLNYEVILDKASIEEFNTPPNGSPPLKGFILGLVLSVLIISIKNVKIEKK
jgi:LPS O-antigen subunit length determinant protein (WzzB/FepE family)